MTEDSQLRDAVLQVYRLAFGNDEANALEAVEGTCQWTRTGRTLSHWDLLREAANVMEHG